MKKYIFNGKQYSYLGTIRTLLKDTILPKKPSDELLASLGVQVVAVEEPEQGPTPEQIQAQLTREVQAYLDTTAQKLGYDSCLSVCSYVNTGVTKFDEEGDAFRKWRSAVWAKGYEIVAAVQDGTREIPTEEELFAELPKIELDREELKDPVGESASALGIPTIGI